MTPTITLRSTFPSSYEEAEAMGLISGDEFTKCPVCGSCDVRRTRYSLEECHGWLVGEYTAVCGGCGAELGIWDHGAIFPSYL